MYIRSGPNRQFTALLYIHFQFLRLNYFIVFIKSNSSDLMLTKDLHGSQLCL